MLAAQLPVLHLVALPRPRKGQSQSHPPHYHHLLPLLAVVALVALVAADAASNVMQQCCEAAQEQATLQQLVSLQEATVAPGVDEMAC